MLHRHSLLCAPLCVTLVLAISLAAPATASGQEIERARGLASQLDLGPLPPGERITLQTRDASLVEILRTFARLAELNLIVEPGVDAPVTVELVDVPWEKALEHILRMHGLAAELDGNILSVGGGTIPSRAAGRPSVGRKSVGRPSVGRSAGRAPGPP